VSKWNPIDTIPHDGAEVLIAFSGGGICISQAPVELSKEDKVKLAKEGHWPDYKNFTPTHWMPLPKPPEDTL